LTQTRDATQRDTTAVMVLCCCCDATAANRQL